MLAVADAHADRSRHGRAKRGVIALTDVGHRVEQHRLTQRASVDRATAIERVRGRFISPLQLLDDGELGEGVARMEAELPEQNEYTLEWLVATAYK